MLSTEAGAGQVRGLRMDSSKGQVLGHKAAKSLAWSYHGRVPHCQEAAP